MKISIRVTPVSSQLRGFLPPVVTEQLSQTLSYEIAGAGFSPKYMAGRWNGRRELFSTRTMTFPTGLLPMVKECLDFHGIEYILTDSRPPLVLGKPIPFSIPGAGDPYDWQQEIIDYSIKQRYGIVKAPTGAGKGVMMCATIARINQPTLILVHKKDLLWQLAERWHDYTGTEMGVIGDGKVAIKHITIAMVQTLARVLDPKFRTPKGQTKDGTKVSNPLAIKRLVQTVPVVLVDETHHVVAKTIYNILKQCKNTSVRLGYSATPFRDEGDDLLVEAALGTKIANITIPWLVARKYLAEPTTYFIRFKHKRAPRSIAYKDLYSQEIAENEDRNKLIVKLAYDYYKKGHKILIAVTYIKHGEILKQMLEYLVGNDVQFINGSTATSERKDLPKQFDAGAFKIGIATTVWGEGVDIPGISVLINAKCGMSRVATLQVAGRALRITKDKTRALLLDIYDHGCRFFEKHSKARISAYESEGLEVKQIETDDV